MNTFVWEKSVRQLKDVPFFKGYLPKDGGDAVIDSTKFKKWLKNFDSNKDIFKIESYLLEESSFFKGYLPKYGGDAVIDSIGFDKWFNAFVGNRILFEHEKKMLEQGVLENKENNTVDIDEDFLKKLIEIAENKSVEEMINALTRSSCEKSYYCAKGLSKKILEDKSLAEIFTTFLCDLLNNRSQFNFQKHVLTDDDMVWLQSYELIPCQYVFDNKYKMLCLLECSTDKIYFVDICYNYLFLNELLTTSLTSDNYIHLREYPMFFNLGISLEIASDIIGCSKTKLSQLIKENIICSKPFDSNEAASQNDDIEIPLCEIFSYLFKTGALHKEERIESLFNQLHKKTQKSFRSGRLPHPLAGNKLFISAQKEIENLKEQNRILNSQIIESTNKKQTPNRNKFIALAIPEIVKIVKKVEEDLKTNNYNKNELTTLGKFIETLSNNSKEEFKKKKQQYKSKIEESNIEKEIEDYNQKLKEMEIMEKNETLNISAGHTVAINIFKALPKKYRR